MHTPANSNRVQIIIQEQIGKPAGNTSPHSKSIIHNSYSSWRRCWWSVGGGIAIDLSDREPEYVLCIVKADCIFLSALLFPFSFSAFGEIFAGMDQQALGPFTHIYLATW